MPSSDKVTDITLGSGPAVRVVVAQPAPVAEAAARDALPVAKKKLDAHPAPAAKGAMAAPTGFFCSLCGIGFNDTLALALHKRSKKHREAAGLVNPEQEAQRSRMPSVEELRAFIKGKAREHAERQQQRAPKAHRAGV